MEGTEGEEKVGERLTREKERERDALGLCLRTDAMFAYRFIVRLWYFYCLSISSYVLS